MYRHDVHDENTSLLDVHFFIHIRCIPMRYQDQRPPYDLSILHKNVTNLYFIYTVAKAKQLRHFTSAPWSYYVSRAQNQLR